MALQLSLLQQKFKQTSAFYPKMSRPKGENIYGLLIIIPHLHLGSTILKPELDLPSLQVKPSTKLQSLFFVRMRTFLKQTVKQTTATLSQYHSTNPVENAN